MQDARAGALSLRHRLRFGNKVQSSSRLGGKALRAVVERMERREERQSLEHDVHNDEDEEAKAAPENHPDEAQADIKRDMAWRHQSTDLRAAADVGACDSRAP